MTEPSDSPRPSGFFDFFRLLLGWKYSPPYVIPLNKGLILVPNGQIHAPTAVKAQIRE
ncbi:MAG: hypothetical protein K6C40_15390 [Thermoguttaceae bacterium]|nr:hypothetical protein [Thermoguttaceae bacterium]